MSDTANFDVVEKVNILLKVVWVFHLQKKLHHGFKKQV